MESARQFVAKQFLPLGLVAAVAAGAAFPAPGAAAKASGLMDVAICGIFLLSGLSLKGGEVASALRATGALAYSVAFILLATPLLGKAAALALPSVLAPPELALGLAVFMCVPTTLSSGVALTLSAKGNATLALLLTVGTNLLGVFTIPFALTFALGGVAVGLDPVPMVVTLAKTILAPLLVGCFVRALVPGVAAFVDANKKAVGYASSCLLITAPWMQVSQSAGLLASVSAGTLLATAAAAVACHLVLLAVNAAACVGLGLGGRDAAGAAPVRRAVTLVASQKTLPVAITVISKLGTALGAQGLLVVPCIMGHLLQIVIDSFIVSSWLDEDEAAGKASAPRAGRDTEERALEAQGWIDAWKARTAAAGTAPDTPEARAAEAAAWIDAWRARAA